MSDYEYLMSCIKPFLNPLPFTEREKEEVMMRELTTEREFEMDREAEIAAWPPCDIALEL